ncbi:MAG: hypothetical protein KDK97_24835, partial [Verrucomicrobiales bacterium]|nr:hypothetical protein [Verrucomicrobiales bacterium]
MRRWQNFLTETAKNKNRIFTAWHVFEKLAPDDFASLNNVATQSLKSLPPEALHPAVKRFFQTPPASMREVAERYGELLTSINAQWQKWLQKSPHATALPSAEDEELRRILYAADSPCSVPDEHLANNEWFFPTSVVVELWKLQAEVDRWLIQSPDAPAYTTILTDRSVPTTARIFLRGNPLTKGDEVTRHFLHALAGEKPRPFTQGSGRLE